MFAIRVRDMYRCAFQLYRHVQVAMENVAAFDQYGLHLHVVDVAKAVVCCKRATLVCLNVDMKQASNSTMEAINQQQWCHIQELDITDDTAEVLLDKVLFAARERLHSLAIRDMHLLSLPWNRLTTLVVDNVYISMDMLATGIAALKQSLRHLELMNLVHYLAEKKLSDSIVECNELRHLVLMNVRLYGAPFVCDCVQLLPNLQVFEILQIKIYGHLWVSSLENVICLQRLVLSDCCSSHAKYLPSTTSLERIEKQRKRDGFPHFAICFEEDDCC